MDRSANYLMHAASKAILPEVWTLRQQDQRSPGSSDGGNGNNVVYNNGIYWQIIANYWGTWQTNQPIVKYSSDLKTWNTITISGISNWGNSTGLSILGVAANGNTIIVVGGSSTSSIGHRIWRSSDNGTTWTTVKSGALNATYDAYYKIMYANGKWVALGNAGMSVSSDDGVSWTDYGSVTSGPYNNAYNFDRIVYANGLWLAPGTNGKVYTHSTLTSSTWTQYTISAAGTNAIKSVEYINGIYVAAYGSSIVYSNDLTTWSAATGITLPSYSDSNLKNILKIKNFSVGGTTQRLVAAGYPNQIYYSDNGFSWTSISGIYYAPSYNIQSYQTLYVSNFITGPNNTIIYIDSIGNWANSSDGISWNVILNSSAWGDIVYNPVSSKFFAVKMESSPLISSSNGLDWTFQTPIQPNTWASPKKIKFDSTWQYGIDHMSIGGGRYTTNYGSTWNYYSETGGYGMTGTTPETGYLTNIVWTGQYFYMIGYTTFKRIATASIGGGWSSAGPSFIQYENPWEAESNGSGTIVVTCNTSGVLVYSTDHGNNWYNTNSTSWKGSRQAMGTAYSPTLDMLVTVGEYDYIARSTNNGSSWTWPTLTGERIYYCATWTGSRFVVGGYGYTLNSIYSPSRAVSTDGVTWTQDNFGLSADYMYDIETNSNYSATIGVCGGYSSYRAFVSTDQGVTWNSYAMSSNPGSICFVTNSIVLAAGRISNYSPYNLTIQRSTNTGQTWTQVYNNSALDIIAPSPAYPGYGNTSIRPVINGDGSVVILFCQNRSTTQTGVLVSTDQGSTWSLNYISGLYGVKIQAYWDGTNFIAHTNIGRKYTSTNGISWTEGTLPTTAYFPPPKDFVIKRGSPASTTRIWSDQDSRGYSSDNGNTWQCYNTIFGWKPRKIIWDGSRFIIITFDSTYIFTATNPSTSWTPISNVTIPGNSTIGGNLKLVSIKYNSIKGKYYIGAIDSLTKITYILSSSDLTSWSIKSSTLASNISAGVELYAGAFSSTRSIMAGNYNTLATYP